MDVLVISNPNSTSITQKNLAQIIPTLMRVDGIRMRSRFTQYAGHAEELARQARTQGWDAVIAVGGDGTVCEVINGLLDVPTDDPDAEAHDILTTNAPKLGIIPTGSANVFARSIGFFGEANQAVQQLAKALEADHSEKVALGSWADASEDSRKEHRWFAVNVGFGADADVIHKMEERREQGLSASPWRYARIAVQAWMESKDSDPAISVEAHGPSGSLQHGDLPLAFVSHTDPWTYLGPFPARIVPDGAMEKGLSFFSVKTNRGWRPLAALAGLLIPTLRRHFESETVTFKAAHEVKLSVEKPRDFQVDGEYKGQYSCVDLRFIPEAVEVFTPVD
ncbi:diacylglycerol/lipid kinase family protein [Corynebacterium urogenitale]